MKKGCSDMDKKTKQGVFKSTCGLCAIGCGIRVHIEADEVVKVEGDPDNPLNRGELCTKGLASLEHLYHPHRLKHPLKREGKRGSGRWRRVSWDEALKEISTHLNKIKGESGAESVGFIHGAAKGLQESYLSRLANVFGSPNVAWQGHVCFVPRVLASRITYGFYAIPDYDNTPSCILVWGKNMPETLHHAYQRIISALEKGTKLIVIDPRETELAKKSDFWVQLRPGSDLALALGMIHVIIDEELFDRAFVDKWTIGFNRLKNHVSGYPPEKVETITWVPSEKIRQAARLYARNRPACIQWGNVIDHGVNAFQNARAICILRAITGNLGAPGGEIQPLSLPLFGRRSPELELIEKMTPNTWEKRVGADMKVLPMIRYVQPQSIIKAIINQDPYPIRGVYIQGANPLLSYPNARKTYEALMKLDFLAVADMFLTPTAALADMVLPVASYLEFDSIVTPPYSYPMTLVQQKVTRIGECRSDYEILAGLAKKLDLGEYFWDREEQCLDYVLRPAGLSFEEFKRISMISGTRQYRRYKEKGFETASGKVEIYSHRLEEWGFDPLPTYQEPPETPHSEQALAEEYPLILTTWKSAPFRHSGGRQVNALRGEHPEPLVYIHPKTAEKADIDEGEWVYIETIRGRIQQKARLTKGIDPKVIGVDYAWWFPEKGVSSLYGWAEANVNILVDDRPPYSPEMGTTNLRGMLCKISKMVNNHDLFRHATI
jgi:anaerobic selenocysteine-containing dehydrogenase